MHTSPVAKQLCGPAPGSRPTAAAMKSAVQNRRDMREVAGELRDNMATLAACTQGCVCVVVWARARAGDCSVVARDLAHPRCLCPLATARYSCALRIPDGGLDIEFSHNEAGVALASVPPYTGSDAVAVEAVTLQAVKASPVTVGARSFAAPRAHDRIVAVNGRPLFLKPAESPGAMKGRVYVCGLRAWVRVRAAVVRWA